MNPATQRALISLGMVVAFGVISFETAGVVQAVAAGLTVASLVTSFVLIRRAL